MSNRITFAIHCSIKTGTHNFSWVKWWKRKVRFDNLEHRPLQVCWNCWPRHTASTVLSKLCKRCSFQSFMKTHVSGLSEQKLDKWLVDNRLGGLKGPKGMAPSKVSVLAVAAVVVVVVTK